MSQKSETTEASGYTHIQTTKFKYTWTINNFRFFCKEPGNPLCSPTFSTDDNNNLRWRLHIQVNPEDPFFVGLYLNCVLNPSKKPVDVECKFSILNGTGSSVKTNIKNGVLFGKSDNSVSLNFPEFIGRETLLKHLKELTLNEKIYVVCEICTSLENNRNFHQIGIPKSKSVLPHLLKLLFENPKFSDVILSANGTDFKVHKSILATQSEVFEAMFNTNMKENFSNRVEITDLSEVTLKELLRFMYTGKVLNLQEMVEDLLWAADKYAIQGLKAMCECELSKKLSIANASAIFTLADMHSANQLKSCVKSFILFHLSDVVKTSEWNMMIKENPKLALEILTTQ